MSCLSRNHGPRMVTQLNLRVFWNSEAHRNSSEPLYSFCLWHECAQASTRQSLSLRMSACPLTPLVRAPKIREKKKIAPSLWTKSTHPSPDPAAFPDTCRRHVIAHCCIWHVFCLLAQGANVIIQMVRSKWFIRLLSSLFSCNGTSIPSQLPSPAGPRGKWMLSHGIFKQWYPPMACSGLVLRTASS